MISFDIHYIVHYIREHKFLFFTYLIMLFVPFIAFIFCLFSADSIMRKDALQYQNSILQHEKPNYNNIIQKNCKTKLPFLRNPYLQYQSCPKIYRTSSATIPTLTVSASTFAKMTHS